MKKKWKELLCIFLVLSVLFLVACAKQEDDVTDEVLQEIESDTEADSDAARLAYYEQMINDLQADVLAMQAELFSARSEYEARLAELEKKQEESVASLPFTYTVSAEGVTITAYNGKEINVAIPATIDARPVVAIGDRAFLNNTTVQSVVVPEGVLRIGWFAFSGCISLGAISLPQSIESISYGAFENCAQSLTVFAALGSYAQRYAESYGIAFSE